MRWVVRALAGGVLVLSVTIGGILGVSELSWDKPLPYTRLTYFADRAVTDMLRVVAPTSWLDRYTIMARERTIWALNIGPFYEDGGENRLIVAREHDSPS